MSHIGLDIGFTGVKAVIFSTCGKILAGSYNDYGPQYRKDLLEKSEINPIQVLACVMKVLSECIARSLKDRPKTIAVSVSGDDIFPADKDGKPLHNVLSAYNQKPLKYRNYILEKLKSADFIFNKTGQVIETDMLGLPRICWLIENIPGLLKKTWKFFCWESYINWYLTGVPATDYSNASRFLTFDVNKNCWSKEILDTFGISENMMPSALPAGTVIGKIKADVADNLDLPTDLIVVTGGFDQATAALGAGLITEGVFSLGMGTVFASHWIVSDFKKISGPKNLYPYCTYLIKDRFMGLFCNFNGSNIVNWFLDNFAAYERNEYKNKVYDYFNEKIDSTPSTLFFMPHFTGTTYPVTDRNSRGVFIGLNLKTDKKELLKAIYEGIGFELKINYLDLIRVSNFKINNIVAVGGSSRSRIWLQILSNILKVNISTLVIDEGGCLSCAVLGAVASGEFNSISEGIERFIKIKETIEPEDNNTMLFKEKFAIYKSIYNNTKKFNHYISKIF